MEDPQSREERKEEEMRAVREGGGGESEGFEEAEAQLIEHASHGDDGPDPSHLAGQPEERTDVEYGEADQEQSAERPDADR